MTDVGKAALSVPGEPATPKGDGIARNANASLATQRTEAALTEGPDTRDFTAAARLCDIATDVFNRMVLPRPFRRKGHEVAFQRDLRTGREQRRVVFGDRGDELEHSRGIAGMPGG